jgi:hypothetical protein
MKSVAWYGGSFAYYDEPPPTPEQLDAAADEQRARRLADFTPDLFTPRPGGDGTTRAELVVMVAAANRDPHDLDVRRSPTPCRSGWPALLPGCGADPLPHATARRRPVHWRDHHPIVRGLTHLPVRTPGDLG